MKNIFTMHSVKFRRKNDQLDLTLYEESPDRCITSKQPEIRGVITVLQPQAAAIIKHTHPD